MSGGFIKRNQEHRSCFQHRFAVFDDPLRQLTGKLGLKFLRLPSKSPWDEIFDRYGGEMLRDGRKTSNDAINIRISSEEKGILRRLSEESGLDFTTLVRIALKFLRDKVKPSLLP